MIAGAELQVGLGALSGALALFAANVLSPGPNVFNTIATAMGSGRAAGFAAAAAVALGVVWWATLALGGAAALFAQEPGAEVVLTLVGGGLLAMFGLTYLRRALKDLCARGRGREGAARALRVRPGRAFRDALAIQLANPKSMTTWLMLASVYPVAAAGAADLALFALAAAAVALFGHCAYALAFSSPLAAAAYARAAWAVTGAVGVAFLALGVGLLWQGAATSGLLDGGAPAR